MTDGCVKHVFSQSLCKIEKLEISEENSEDNIKIINAVLDELNSLEHKDVSSDIQILENLLSGFIKLIPDNNDHILSKFCHFVYSIHHMIKVPLSIECIECLREFVIKALNSCCSWVLADVLIALGVLLKEGTGCSEKLFDRLVGPNGVLIDLASSDRYDVGIKHVTFKCLQALTLNARLEWCGKYITILRSSVKSLQGLEMPWLVLRDFMRKPNHSCLSNEHLLLCYNICEEHLKSLTPGVNIITYCKTLVCSLKCLRNICAYKILRIPNVGELLGSLKVLLYYGLPGQTSLVPTCLYPTLMSQYAPGFKIQEASSFPKLRKQNKKTRRNRQKKKQVSGQADDKSVRTDREDFPDSGYAQSSSSSKYSLYSISNAEHNMYPDWIKSSSSDSEFSDTEGEDPMKIRLLQSRVRQNAYSCLQTVLTVMDKKTVFGYWSSFLPDTPVVSAGYNLNIFTSILKDPSPQVRFGALCLLSDMIRGSKQFLSLVEECSSSRTSYTPVSSVLSSMVNELHRRLLLALVSENSSALLTQILKCYAVVVDNVPYKRLNSDILLKLLRHLRPFINHTDLQVQVACLTAYGSIINSCEVPDIVIAQLLESNDSSIRSKEIQIPEVHQKCEEKLSPSADLLQEQKHFLPWIVEVCKNNLINKSPLSPLPVRLESLQVLGIFVGRYFHVMRKFLSFLEELLLLCLIDVDFSVQLHGAKLLEITGRCILNDINSDCTEHASHELVTIEIAFEFWNHLLSGPLPACLMNSMEHALQSVCCDCLSTIPADVFEELPKKFRILCITLLLGLANDTDSSIQGAAIRCLGVYSLFSCLREDLVFLSDVANILVNAVKDTNFNIRSKASWALGNLSDALLLSRKQWPTFCEKVTVTFFHSICVASIILCEDCDKVRCNAVRTLGNLLRYAPSKFLENLQIVEFVKSATLSLLSALSASIMKVCWNACYALGNALQNNDLTSCKVLDIENILLNLMGMLKCTNFKVRINAALALSALPDRHLYGNLFGAIWSQLVATLCSSQDDVDFKELKHHESLCNQICFSLIQLILLMEIKDLDDISEKTMEAAEALLMFMWKFGFRANENKISEVCGATEHLISLSNNGELSKMAQQMQSLLQDALEQVKLAFHDQEICQ